MLDKNIRFTALDALRGISAIIVVIFHYHHFYLRNHLDRTNVPSESLFPYASLFKSIFEHGHSVVQLFWVISGFVFYHVYKGKSVSTKSFVVNRFARLYPLHFATLLLVALLQFSSMHCLGHWQIYGNNDALHFLLQLVMSSNWVGFSHGLSFNGPIWSVSLEIFVYGMFFVCLRLISGFGLLTSSVITLISLVTFLYLPSNGYIKASTFLCAVYFFSGGLLYVVLTKTRKNPLYTAQLILIFLAALVISLLFARGEIAVYLFSISLAGLASMLDIFKPLKSKLFQFLGDISYSLYLVHVPIQMCILLAVDLLFGGGRAIAESYVLLPAFLVISVGVAFLTYYYFEKPLNNILRQKLK